jgi:hypothetical protein
MPIRFAVWGAVVGTAACLAIHPEARAAESKRGDSKKGQSRSSFGSGAEGVNTTTGKVVSAAGQSVEVQADNGKLTFQANKASKAILATVAQLAPSDNVTITWVQKDGKRWIQKIEGRDTVEGIVTGRTDLAVEVRPEQGAVQRILFPWAGVSPEQVAKMDQQLLKRIGQARIGDKVRLTWEISDAKRAVDVKYLAKAPGQKPPTKAGAQKDGQHHHGPAPRQLLKRAKRMGH